MKGNYLSILRSGVLPLDYKVRIELTSPELIRSKINIAFEYEKNNYKVNKNPTILAIWPYGRVTFNWRVRDKLNTLSFSGIGQVFGFPPHSFL